MAIFLGFSHLCYVPGSDYKRALLKHMVVRWSVLNRARRHCGRHASACRLGGGHSDAWRRDHRRRRTARTKCGENRRFHGGRRRDAGALFHPRHRALWRGAVISSFRALCLSARRLGALKKSRLLKLRIGSALRAY